MRLKDRVALVTGSSGGIGKAIALAFAREGADIVINYRSNDAGAKDAYDKIKAMGRRALVFKANVASTTEVDGMVQEALKEFGRIDILVNNAAYGRYSRAQQESILNVTDEDYESVMGVNVKGAVNCTRAVAPSMVKNRYGKIINISSIAGSVAGPGTASLLYALSKGALNTLTRKLALDLGPHNINVNAISPATIVGGSSHDTRPKEEQEARSKVMVQKIILGRLGKLEDCTYAAIFFASDESSYITGQTLMVDGGRTDLFTHQ